MSNIYNCERIQKRIENNSHYGPCFWGDVYNSFLSKRNDLEECRKCYDEITKIENELINSNYNNQNLNKELDNIKIIGEKKYVDAKNKFKNEENIKAVEYDNKIKDLIKKNENNKIQIENDLKLIDQDILNLKKEITNLELKYEKEVDYLKKINLNKIKNEYKLKLVKYQNEKEKEKERKLAQMEIKKREFEAKKECEINDMKNKALFVQELIAIFKTNILNS